MLNDNIDNLIYELSAKTKASYVVKRGAQVVKALNKDKSLIAKTFNRAAKDPEVHKSLGKAALDLGSRATVGLPVLSIAKEAVALTDDFEQAKKLSKSLKSKHKLFKTATQIGSRLVFPKGSDYVGPLINRIARHANQIVKEKKFAERAA